MDYQTFLNDAIEWLFSDINNGLYILGGIAVLGAINGIRRSLKHCRNTRHVGRMIL